MGLTQVDADGQQLGKLSDDQTDAIRRRHAELLEGGGAAPIRHEWRPGDVALTDNRRVCHRGPSQEELQEVRGTRVLHRTIALGA